MKNDLIVLKRKTEAAIAEVVQEFMDKTGIWVKGVDVNVELYRKNGKVDAMFVTSVNLLTQMVRWKETE